MPEETKLQEMRCRCCGTFMGYRTRIGRFVFWCSEDCADTPMAKWEENQIRDEVIVEMFLDGQGIMEISRNLNNWPYQYVQQTLARRGLQEFMRQEEEPPEEPPVAAQRVRLVRSDKKAS